MASGLPFLDINLHASDSYYAFTSPSNPTSPSLIVDRPSGDLRLADEKPSGAKRISSISGILGTIKLRLDKYIVVITKSKPVGKLRGSMIYKIISTDVLPLRERPLHDHDEDAYLDLLKNLLKRSPMYFSYALDLTNAFQRQVSVDSSLPLWKRADDRFFWNKFLATDLIDFRSGSSNTGTLRLNQGAQPAVDSYILPVISGMLSLTRSTIKNNPLTFLLVTRKSRHRIGTRYFSRGIDDQGNVSNFNETEQIVVFNDSDSSNFDSFSSSNGPTRGGANNRDIQVLSYVQTRGSVPVYWAEVNKLKYTPELQVRGVDGAVQAAKLHFDEQIRLYGDNYLVNLVNQKGREKRIKDAYESMVRQLQTSSSEKGTAEDAVQTMDPKTVQSQFDRLHYVYFDFHNETKGLQFQRSRILLDQMQEGLHKQQYFHGVFNPNDRTGRIEVRSNQKSVVRTNCMDCLDRTNVVQSMLGRYTLNRMLHDLQVLSRNEAFEDDEGFEFLFRNVWADNADVVSKSYSGTGALKTDFTRTGQRSSRGALQDLNNSITRYVRNNFLDGPRQDAFDLFSGVYLPSSASQSTVFIDRRPILIQAIPYTLAGSLFFVFIASVTSRLPDATVWPLRLLMLFFTALAIYCGSFMWGHGTLFINWPKLNTPPWAADAYQEAAMRARKDPIVGQLIAHSRSLSDSRMTFLEEGKKRIE